MGRKKVAIADRFWKFVDKSAGADGCWPFTGKRNDGGDGYGIIDDRLAHRVSYELSVGQIPRGLCVLHRCDNPPCCNPAHLFIGTRTDNSMDRDAKGRTVHGEAFVLSKLKETDVALIRAMRSSGETWTAISVRFPGISVGTLRSAASGRSWAKANSDAVQPMAGGHQGKISLEDRFWPKVLKTNGCWNWTGGKHQSGFGMLSDFVTGRRYNKHYAHRLAFQFCVGPIQDGFTVLQTCENRLCCRPDHLKMISKQEAGRMAHVHA